MKPEATELRTYDAQVLVEDWIEAITISPTVLYLHNTKADLPYDISPRSPVSKLDYFYWRKWWRAIPEDEKTPALARIMTEGMKHVIRRKKA